MSSLLDEYCLSPIGFIVKLVGQFERYVSFDFPSFDFPEFL